MNFTISEIEVLTKFIQDNSRCAIILGDLSKKALLTGELNCQIDQSIKIPKLPKHISKKGRILTFKSNSLISFFVTYYCFKNEQNPSDALRKIYINGKYKIKIESYHELLLLIQLGVEKIPFVDLFQKGETNFHEAYYFFKIAQYLELKENDLILLLRFLKNENEGYDYSNELYEFSKVQIELADKLYVYLINSEDDSLKKFIPPVVKALSEIFGIEKYYEDINKLVNNNNNELKCMGLFTLKLFNYSTEKYPIVEVKSLAINYLTDENENVVSNASRLLFELYIYDNTLIEIITELSIASSISVRRELVFYIWINSKRANLKNSFDEVILNLIRLHDDNETLLGTFGYILQDKFSSGDKENAKFLLEEIIKKGNNVSQLNETLWDFANKDNNFFSVLITKWLHSRDVRLLNSLTFFLSIRGQICNLKLDIKLLDELHPQFAQNIIYGIVGFIYDKDIISALLISILDSIHVYTFYQHIADLFVDYICYSYPSTIENYIKPELEKSEGIKKDVIENIIHRTNDYYENIRKLPFHKELAASEKREATFFKNFGQWQNEIQEKAQSKGFLAMVKNITLRTGNIWFCKTENGYSEESLLSKYNSELEMPRAEYIDPALFEVMRINFRKIAIS